MHDAMVVRVGERARDVAQNAHRLGDRQRAAPQPSAETLAFDVGHRIVGQPIEVTRREHGDDVRLLQRRCDADLALEAGGGHRRRQLRREELHHDLPAEAVLFSDEYPGHATAAELALERVVA